jgi:hypothetical protein
VRNATRLEYLKRRRSRLLSKQRKLQMLQHDLYDVLVKLQALLSGETTAHPEEVASRCAMLRSLGVLDGKCFFCMVSNN